MAAGVREGRGGLAGWPWVTLLVAVALGGGAAWMQTASVSAVQEFEERRAEVRQYFDEHLYLALDHDLEKLLEGPQFERQQIYLQEREDTGFSHIPKSRTRSEQSRLAALARDAMTARAQLPAGLYGVSSTTGPPSRLFTHAAAHETGLALCLTLIVLLIAGLALENAWGHLLFALFCGVSTAGLGWVRALSAPAGELPWAGSSGLAVALLGAYMALTLRGHVRYYGGLLSGWLLLPIWLVAQYTLIHHLWEPGFDRSLFFIHSVGAAAGFVVASLAAAAGLERRADGSVQPQAAPAARAIGQARRAQSGGQTGQAFALLKAEAERLPSNSEIVAALWQLAKELGQESEAAPAVVALAKRALREDRGGDAAKLWMDLVAAGVWPNAEPLILVRMGEALLDEGHATEALAAMRRAAESDEPIVSALALRIVKVARDLDPDLTCVSAKLALADPRLPDAQREELWNLASAAASAMGEAPEEHPVEQDSAGIGEASQPLAVESTPPPDSPSADSPGGLEAPTEPQRGDDFGQMEDLSLEDDIAAIEELDPDALSEDTLAEFFEAAEESPPSANADEIASWNDPGQVEDLSAEEGPSANADEIASWNDPGQVGDLRAEVEGDEEDSTDTLALELPPEEISTAIGGVDPDGFSADGFSADGISAAIDDDDLDAMWNSVQQAVDTAVEYDTPTCTLKVVAVTPIAFEPRGLVLDVGAEGKTSLAYDRVEAVAVGAVEGIVDKPIIVIDLVLNWTEFGNEELRVLRIRSDAFDPGQLVPGASPLESLTAVLDTLLARTNATPLPDREGARGKPFARFQSLSAYEAEVLGADPFQF